MATPHVTGAVAFLHSVASQAFKNHFVASPDLAALVLRDIILDNVDVIPSLTGLTTSNGRLNLHKAAEVISTWGNLGTAFCEGNTLPCWCGNVPTAGTDEGCRNATGAGALLSGSGTPSISADSLVLTIEQGEPNEFAIFVSNIATGGNIPLFDGVLCLLGDANLNRHVSSPTYLPIQLDATGTGTNAYPLSVTDFTGQTVPGATVYYQVWYRSPNGPCLTYANTSSGRAITWLP